jgi:hypothetical protein
MFQFAYRPPPRLWIQRGVSGHHSRRVAPFGFSRLIARMQLPLNVSPVSASFFGLTRPGIPRGLSLACGSHSLSVLSCPTWPACSPWLAPATTRRTDGRTNGQTDDGGGFTHEHTRWVCAWLASVSLLFALGKIEVITLFSWKRTRCRGSSPNNWNVESHHNLACHQQDHYPVLLALSRAPHCLPPSPWLSPAQRWTDLGAALIWMGPGQSTTP